MNDSLPNPTKPTKPTVRLSLISHTNVGKTTLARTLLRETVGEVRDQAHVTDENTSYTLLETADARLLLWDTPGFGDTARLMKRLRTEKQPLGWLLHQVWDRFADRALFSNQRAVHNVQQETDAVLYLVNAAEHPEEAGYVRHELELLQWIGRPVLMLLNQVGSDRDAQVERWRSAFREFSIVRDAMALDAFTRCWVQEGKMLRRVGAILPEAQQPTMQTVIAEWERSNRETFRSSCKAMGRYLAETAADREEAVAPSGGSIQRLAAGLSWRVKDQPRARKALNQRLVERTSALMICLIELHGLTGSSAAAIEQQIEDFETHGGLPLDEKSGAVAGGVLSGLLGGLAADVMSGGLSLGGGAIAGGILGALGGSALAKGYRMIRGEQAPSVRWSPEFLDRLTGQVLLRYLSVAHFGRGRGDYEDIDQPGHWRDAVSAATLQATDRLHRQWERLETNVDDTALGAAEAGLSDKLERTLTGILADAYPDSRF